MDKEKLKNFIMGTATGDALGLPFDGAERDMFDASKMVECYDDSLYHVPAGTWSDKTSYVLMGMDLINAPDWYKEKAMNAIVVPGGDPPIERFIPEPEKIASGYGKCILDMKNGTRFCSTEPPFTVQEEILSYLNGNPKIADNGMCLLQTLPLAFYDLTPDEYLTLILQLNKELYDTPEMAICCLVSVMLAREFCIGVTDRAAMLNVIFKLQDDYYIPELDVFFAKKLNDMGRNDLTKVCDTSGILINTLWCIFNTMTFKDAVSSAVELGNVASTYGALCGAYAGLIYGKPERTWAGKLVKQKELNAYISGFFIPDPAIPKRRMKVLASAKPQGEEEEGGNTMGLISSILGRFGKKQDAQSVVERKVRSKYNLQ